MKTAGGQSAGAVMNGALNVQISAFDSNATRSLEIHTSTTQTTSAIKAVKSVILQKKTSTQKVVALNLLPQ